ncbi:hypothetical protein BFM98_12875 [Lysinibacillus sp. AR18-8]|uniref:DUF7448 domain-containing protein n=1 Tax=Lysinibacillus sp. AR18-8 TaxID=1889781 RepID=UPI0008242DA5|nr:hypothetical protein [Lysinibacillus sp. AR18-8]OCX63715.1 hypothetical protein BFM98_12875 [Lysinibacillus sp. AR18-8]
MASIEMLLNKTLISIEQDGNDELYFLTAEGDKFKMYHEQDCCESVWLEETIGDLEDLIGNPLLMADEVIESPPESDNYESATWTFYKFATIKGYVTLCWVGESNGYYSESVNFRKVN